MEPDDNNTHSFVALIAGTVVSHYRIVEKIGAGGMGEVYLAEDTQLDRKVALKFLPPHLSRDQDSRSRFTREAKAAAKLDHPNIAPVHEVGEFQGRPFFAMAHIEGHSLREVIKQGKLSTSEAIRLTMQICEGLHEAHSAGVVHRDIKPGNIIIDTKGRPRLLDFGLATVSGEEKLTKTGSTLGTVGYMAPEQIEGKDVDHRADLFSVGVILYEMLTGRRPFEGDNDAAVVKAITSSTPEPVARFKSGVTGELQQIVDKALAKDVSIRYQHADGMLADLKRLSLRDAPVRRSRLSLWVAASAVAVIVAGYFAYTAVFKKSLSVSGPKRLVVLPFDNLGDSTQAYFASGVTDEVISRLSGISGLSVVSRMSAARLKRAGIDLQGIGDSLDAEFVLDASARYQIDSDGNRRVKLTTQLINVTEDRVVWSQTYDTVSTELFDLQSEMAIRVADELGVVLSPREERAVWVRYTDSEEAYDYYLRGNRYFFRGIYGVRKDLRLALEMFDQAIELDSSFSLTYSRMSQTYSRLWTYYLERDDSIAVLAKTRSEDAFRTSESDAEESNAHFARASYHYRVEKDLESALGELDIAFHEYGGHDNYRYLWSAFPIHRDLGQWDKALEYVRRASELEPLVANLKYDLATLLEYVRQYDEAEEQYLLTIKMRPDWINGYYRLVEMYINWMGDTQKARALIARSWDKVDTTRWTYLLSNFDVIDGRPEDAFKRGSESDHFSFRAWHHWVAGNLDSARYHYDSLAVLWEENSRKYPDNPFVWSVLGRLYARLGRKELALSVANKAIEMRPLSTNAMRATQSMMELFNVYVYLGELDTALVRAEQLLSMPSELGLGLLLVDPDYKHLIQYPGFARLVSEYGDEHQTELYEQKVGPL
ncbi:MAG: protein kinase [Candidatus Zixiibacteriota bacterium]|nr:MAG: protein kinase [candidate division Zixibacteria bacterium]